MLATMNASRRPAIQVLRARSVWGAALAASFLWHCTDAGSPHTSPAEGGTGGEAGALGGEGGVSEPAGALAGAPADPGDGGSAGDQAGGAAGGGGQAGSLDAGGQSGDAGAPAAASVVCSGSKSQSCQGLATQCQGESCCAESLIPAIAGVAYKATGVAVTLDAFWLDKYEVTTGRFRKFVESYDSCRPGNPSSNAGAGVAPGTGWDSTWNASLAGDSATLTSKFACHEIFHNWDLADDALPMNCVSWFEAFAFCAWDGGRLPTELEWEHAASDDDFLSTYPWGDLPVLTDMQDDSASYANYYCMGDGSGPGFCD